MHTFFQVHLSHRRETELLKNVNEQAHLDAVTHKERHGFQCLAPSGIFSRQRLYKSREFRIKQIQKGSRHQFSDAPTAARVELATDAEGALVKALDVHQAWLSNQRSQDAVHKARMDIDDVRINPGNQIPFEHIKRFPKS